ncbi:DapH/DapD/GlmU-related protein [uncultured Victivallis sp.]|uniref:acyltransferase n=1 Tax=uncultured Victivallis sp. TaxID=354118 RepID=UPI0034574D14
MLIERGLNCWIGAKATILDGARIGDNSIVAAGAVVCRGEYPAGVILGGVPAKVIKRIGSLSGGNCSHGRSGIGA